MDLWRWKPDDSGPNNIKPIAFKTLLTHTKDIILDIVKMTKKVKRLSKG